MRPKLKVIEPSKTGFQHITFIECCLLGLSGSQYAHSHDFELYASRSTLKNLGAGCADNYSLNIIPVIHPHLRLITLKTLIELFVLLRLVSRKASDDVLLVTCVLPTSLVLLELFNIFFRIKNVFFVLHGELEGVEDSSWNMLRVGAWSKLWFRIFPAFSTFNYVVLEDFIFDRLVELGLPKTKIRVLHHIIRRYRSCELKNSVPSACLIGFGTKNKGMGALKRLAGILPEYDFFLVGAGVRKNLRTGESVALDQCAGFLGEISRCHYCLCLFESGYSLTLSASTLDAIACGVKVLALDRPFTRNLSKVFSSVAIFDSIEALACHLREFPFCDSAGYDVDSSIYSLTSISKDFERLV